VALMLGLSSRAAVITGLALSQIGEFSFILSKVGETYGLLGSDTYQLFLAVSILTMGVTPLVLGVAPRVADATSTWPGLRLFKNGAYFWMAIAPEPTEAAETAGDHLVIIGFGLNGQNIARAARAVGVTYVVVEMNPDSVRRFRKAGEPIMYGDATSAGLLKQAGVVRARVVVVAISGPSPLAA
jgi:CPA2 family monovalent cation:H+ antiporter-2